MLLPPEMYSTVSYLQGCRIKSTSQRTQSCTQGWSFKCFNSSANLIALSYGSTKTNTASGGVSLCFSFDNFTTWLNNLLST